MSDVVVELLVRKLNRACPKCGYLIAQFMLESMIINPACPGCGLVKLSEFVRVDL
jgi:ribosomal protein S27AE